MEKELKPEDVMKALEHCAKHHINECKKCPYRNHNHCFGTLLEDALALLREKDARIEHLEKTMRESILSNTKLLKNLNKLVEEKDAEIERLQAEIKRYENTCGKLIVRDNGEVVGFIEGQEKTYISKEIARVLRSMAVNTARAEAIDEFAERLKAIYNSPMYKPTKEHPIKHTRVELLLCLIDKTVKELKGEVS